MAFVAWQHGADFAPGAVDKLIHSLHLYSGHHCHCIPTSALPLQKMHASLAAAALDP